MVFLMGQLSAQTDGCPWAGEDKTICSGECVLIGCELSDNEDGICFLWESNGEQLDENGIHSNQMEVCPTETTIYTLYISNDAGDLIATDEVSIFVKPSILPEITPEHGYICSLDGLSETLQVNENYISYIWSTGETNTSSIMITEAGEYSVTVIDEFGCEFTAESKIVDISLDDNAIETYLIDNGFYCIPLTLIQFPTVSNPSPSRFLEEDIIVDFGEGEFNLTMALNEYFGSLNNDGLSTNSFVTTNADFCSGVMATTETDFDQASQEDFLNIWYHLVDNPDSDDDCLYVRQSYFIDEETDLSIDDEDPLPEICDCNPVQRTIIGGDQLRAISMLNIAIEKLENYDGTEPLEVGVFLRQFFAGHDTQANAAFIRVALRIIRYKMRYYSRYSCVNLDPTNHPQLVGCYSSSHIAQAWPGIHNYFIKTHLCVPTYFNESDKSRAETLIHEATHAYLATADIRYYNGNNFDDMEYLENISNADSYSNFVLSLQQNSGTPFPSLTLLSQVYHGMSSLESAFDLDNDTPLFANAPEANKSFGHVSINNTVYDPYFESSNGTLYVAVPNDYPFLFEDMGVEGTIELFNSTIASYVEFDVLSVGQRFIGKKESIYYLIEIIKIDEYDETCNCDAPGVMEFLYKKTE